MVTRLTIQDMERTAGPVDRERECYAGASNAACSGVVASAVELARSRGQEIPDATTAAGKPTGVRVDVDAPRRGGFVRRIGCDFGGPATEDRAHD